MSANYDVAHLSPEVNYFHYCLIIIIIMLFLALFLESTHTPFMNTKSTKYAL